MDRSEEPNTLFIPISLVLVVAMNNVRPNNPNMAIIIVKIVARVIMKQRFFRRIDFREHILNSLISKLPFGEFLSILFQATEANCQEFRFDNEQKSG